jgi:hypothetical protein
MRVGSVEQSFERMAFDLHSALSFEPEDAQRHQRRRLGDTIHGNVHPR